MKGRTNFAALALVLAVGALSASPALADSLSGNLTTLPFGLDTVRPETRFYVTTIDPGGGTSEAGPLSPESATVGQSGPLSGTATPAPLYRAQTGDSECRALAKLKTGDNHGLVPGCGRR